jgi:hypothetical protein
VLRVAAYTHDYPGVRLATSTELMELIASRRAR